VGGGGLAFEAWGGPGSAPGNTPPAALPRAYAAQESRWRQYRAVLGVHGIAVNEIDVGAGDDARAALR